MKVKIEDIEAHPSKRLYLSIIADYHTKTALSELIDNAIDNWIFGGKKGNLYINIDLVYERQGKSNFHYAFLIVYELCVADFLI